MPLPHPGQDVEEGLVVVVEDVDVDPDTGEEVESLQQGSHLSGLTVLLLPLRIIKRFLFKTIGGKTFDNINLDIEQRSQSWQNLCNH